jgi:hypothetical protein
MSLPEILSEPILCPPYAPAKLSVPPLNINVAITNPAAIILFLIDVSSVNFRILEGASRVELAGS